MVAILTINNADNQVVAYLNGQQVYNRSTENDPTFSDTVPLTSNMIPGPNSLLIVGVNWGGPAHFAGNLSIDGVVTQWSYQVPSSANGLIWNQVFAIYPSGVTINFSGLVDGQNTNSYDESGYNLSCATNFHTGRGILPPGKTVSPVMNPSVFTFKRIDNTGFKIDSIMLGDLQGNNAQTVRFTGYLISGGTVIHDVTVPVNYLGYEIFAFPDSFTNLSSVVWTPGLTWMTNVNVAPP